MPSSPAPRSMPSRSALASRPGFTLLELVTVVSIVGVLAAVSVPRINANRQKADAATNQVRTLIQRAQRLALTQQHDVFVGVDTLQGRLVVYEDRNNDLVADATDKHTWYKLEQQARFVKPPVRIGGQSATSGFVGGLIRGPGGSIPGVLFRRDGSASWETEIYVGVGAGSRRELRAVRVRRSPGRADWYRYVGGTAPWKEGGQ